MSDDFLSLMQRKTAKNEAWRPKCAAPKLVYDTALFFETLMSVLRTYYVPIIPWYHTVHRLLKKTLELSHYQI